MKAGTTWVWHQLNAHPEVRMPFPKERHYFDELGVRPREYLNSFDFPCRFLVGEYTPGYICAPHAPVLVKELCPDARLLVVLRNPVDRAFSHWKVAVTTEGKIPAGTPFIKSFRGNFPRETTWGTIKARGLYAQQLEKWYNHFPKKQIRIMLYEDLRRPLYFLRGLYKWLGIDPHFIPPNHREHKNVNFSKTNPVFKQRDKEEVLDFYLPSIENLEKLIGRDLSSWKQVF